MIKKMALIGAVMALFAIAGCGDSTPVAPSSLVVKTASPITLSWDRELAASSYNIYRGTVSGSLSTKAILATNAPSGNTSPLTTYTDTSAIAGTTYY
jgi:fibronectin type 3 domain-containing protein